MTKYLVRLTSYFSLFGFAGGVPGPYDCNFMKKDATLFGFKAVGKFSRQSKSVVISNREFPS